MPAAYLGSLKYWNGSEHRCCNKVGGRPVWTNTWKGKGSHELSSFILDRHTSLWEMQWAIGQCAVLHEERSGSRPSWVVVLCSFLKIIVVMQRITIAMKLKPKKFDYQPDYRYSKRWSNQQLIWPRGEDLHFSLRCKHWQKTITKILRKTKPFNWVIRKLLH